MTRAHFRLTLSAQPPSIIRLVQILEYGYLRVHASQEDAIVSRELAKALGSQFPNMSAEAAFYQIFGPKAPDFAVTTETKGRITIESGSSGVDLVAIIKSIAIAAPEALRDEMIYTPKRAGPVEDTSHQPNIH